MLDVARSFAPPFQPSEIVRQCAEVLGNYGQTTVTGDTYAAAWCECRKCGITYIRSDKPKSEIYLEARPLFTSGVVELLDVPQLRTQLLLLERRPRAGGRDSVDHPRGAHDDLANSACGALRLAAKLAFVGQAAEQGATTRHRCLTTYDPWSRGVPLSSEGGPYG